MYKCIVCEFNTKSKINYEVHIKTKKHLKKMSPEILPEVLPEILPEVLPESITLIIEEEPERKDKTFEYYQKYLTLYNELDMFRKDNCELIHKGTSVWIQLMRELNMHFKECFFSYDLKRNYWKPIKSQCLLSMFIEMREKETKWNKNNQGISIEHAFRVWDKKMTYLCVDIRDYFGRPKL